jgi:hypothetical protein
MIEFVIGFFMAVAAIEVTTDIAGKAYDYAEPKVTQGVEYIQEKINHPTDEDTVNTEDDYIPEAQL